MKKNNVNELSSSFPVIKYDYNGRLVASNGTALPLLGQWNCRQGAPIPSAIMKTYPEMAFALKDRQAVECVVVMGDCKVWFDIVPYPEAGYIGMYGHSIEMVDADKTPILRMAG